APSLPSPRSSLPPTSTPRASTSGPKRILWRAPPATIPPPGAALPPPPPPLQPWPTGLAPVRSPRSPWDRRGAFGFPSSRLLEARGCAVLLVDPQQVQNIKGRPTRDGHDCQGIQRLHIFGLLARAFRPADHICVLRSSLRQRAMLLTYAGQPIQPRQKALTQ